jgi:hypothetical protein
MAVAEEKLTDIALPTRFTFSYTIPLDNAFRTGSGERGQTFDLRIVA